jgi:hypothetical protein
LRCDLREARFNNVKIGRVKFIECVPGATFDTEPAFTSDEPEVTLVLGPGKAEETYRKKNIKQALILLRAAVEKGVQKPLPSGMGERAALTIFRSLYKSDEVRLDYPEVRKIQNSLRAWLRGFDLNDDVLARYVSLFTDFYNDLSRTPAGFAQIQRARRQKCHVRIEPKR